MFARQDVVLMNKNGYASIEMGVRHITSSDPVLAGIIESIGKCTLVGRSDYYASLVGTIINQQLSGSAADAIYSRMVGELSGSLEPLKVLELTEEQFRRSGVSRSKERFIRELSEKFAGNAGFLRDVGCLPDGEVVSVLTEINGIGRWTAEMFMIFSLGRLDVLPLTDAGFRIFLYVALLPFMEPLLLLPLPFK